MAAVILGWVALVTVTATLAVTFFTIWTGKASADQFLQLTDLLLSWDVIAGGLAIAAGTAFYTEIKALLDRIAKK